jgi:hypothetical protein
MEAERIEVKKEARGGMVKILRCVILCLLKME